ncbi:MAG: DUF3795 domain-containing protein [Proteobacteria bacterium]|nr:DUF3795 domain-containing protein [Pseudomonadota bacterium]
MISYCGLDCRQCGAYIATKTDDDDKRKEVAAMWSKMFQVEIDPKTINCTGCQSDNGILFSHCSVCDIRKCGMGKDMENCAHCGDYACDKLKPMLDMLPHAKKSLEKIRSQIQG